MYTSEINRKSFYFIPKMISNQKRPPVLFIFIERLNRARISRMHSIINKIMVHILSVRYLLLLQHFL